MTKTERGRRNGYWYGWTWFITKFTLLGVYFLLVMPDSLLGWAGFIAVSVGTDLIAAARPLERHTAKHRNEGVQ